ncbi:hypothetical protein N7468_006094 [Penicillium chermesinum]|uniref:DUF7053 domain-containing protein n=1 Tax=Penicillium chermesinum TaxID=63820 RepID=A0A9W9TP39_9EURO|nr:uncharacterized protein N7468_006094 [Penicillium chermesinum]KAJ5233138.1 hypothetical protein N7468_006094 [Penicillium chermesinum]
MTPQEATGHALKVTSRRSGFKSKEKEKRTARYPRRSRYEIGLRTAPTIETTTMGLEIPSVAELKDAAESGERITPQDVSAISQMESELTGRGPLRGGPAAFNRRPGQESVSAHLHHIADRNERLRPPPDSANVPTQVDYVDLANEVQEGERTPSQEGPLPRRSMAAEMQSAGFDRHQQCSSSLGAFCPLETTQHRPSPSSPPSLGYPETDLSSAFWSNLSKKKKRKMQRWTKFTNRTPLPPSVSEAAVVRSLHDHEAMITQNPLVIHYERCPVPEDALPDESDASWYELTDRVDYLPGGLLQGRVRYRGCFHDTPQGIRTHIYAPLGVRIRNHWTVRRSQAGLELEERNRAAVSLGIHPIHPAHFGTSTWAAGGSIGD